MSAADLLSRLRSHHKTGPGRWSASCPGPLHARGDRHHSLSVRELDDGCLLVHCHAGCGVEEVLGAVGMELADLYPPRALDTTARHRRIKRPWRLQDVLRVFDYELTLMAVFMADLAAGREPTEADRRRAAQCASRLLFILREVEHAA